MIDADRFARASESESPRRSGSAGTAPGNHSPSDGVDVSVDGPQLIRQNDVVSLWLQGKTQRQIATRLGINISTVIGDLDTARSTLRDQYASTMQENSDQAVAMTTQVLDSAWDMVYAHPNDAHKYLNIILRGLELVAKLQGTIKDSGRTLNIAEIYQVKMYGFEDRTPPPLELTGRVVDPD